MTLLLSIYKLFLNIIYFFLKFFPTKSNRILFLSRQSDTPSIDFLYMIEDINKRYPDREVKVLTKRMEKNNIKQVISYVFHPLVQLYYLSTSSICITDGYQIAISCVHHKKSLRIIQIWHSMGAIKKFGYQTLNNPKDKKVAEIMHMHRNYDVIISGSKEMTKYFSETFNYPEDKFFVCSLPRVDYLLESKRSNREKVYREYPKLKNKNVVLYVPTFRTYDDYRIDEIIDKFKNSKFELIIKIHPRMKIDVPSKYTYDKASSLELLSIADYVITDYSAISIEAAILDKPVLLYIYDLEKYNEVEGVNPNLNEDLPGYVFDNIGDLYECIKKNKYDKRILERYKEKYIANSDGTATKTLVDYILGGSKNEKN